ncbi:hypothetical protein B0H13DRAFT_1882083 [Mycena leptocephala]|nr:hypothetical protein B0H13DRAFT_1882083 [Mycena leptocephala]
MSASEVLGDERGHDTTGGQREKWATEEEELLGLLGGIAGEDGGRDGTSQATAPSGLMLRAQHRQKFHKQPSASEPVFASVSDFEFKEGGLTIIGFGGLKSSVLNDPKTLCPMLDLNPPAHLVQSALKFRRRRRANSNQQRKANSVTYGERSQESKGRKPQAVVSGMPQNPVAPRFAQKTRVLVLRILTSYVKDYCDAWHGDLVEEFCADLTTAEGILGLRIRASKLGQAQNLRLTFS